MSDDTRVNGRPITTFTVPVAVLITVMAGGLWAGFGWWQSELSALRNDISVHHMSDGHPGALAKIAALDREISALRERLSTFDAQLLERDRERVRRLEAQEARSQKRDVDWEEAHAAFARIDLQLQGIQAHVDALCTQHPRLSMQDAAP